MKQSWEPEHTALLFRSRFRAEFQREGAVWLDTNQQTFSWSVNNSSMHEELSEERKGKDKKKKIKKKNLQTLASALEDNTSSRIWNRFTDALSLGRENAH